MNNIPHVNYEKILQENGIPVTDAEVRQVFDSIVKEEGLITNQSRMSPFWRLITAIVITPWSWIKDLLINTVLKNAFLATAEGNFLDLFAYAVNLKRKEAVATTGYITFYKEDENAVAYVKASTKIQTERINGEIYCLAVDEDTTIQKTEKSKRIRVTATEKGQSHNLAPGYYRILAEQVRNISYIENTDNWLISPGADREIDDEFRARIKNQFNVVGNYHTDAVYRGMIASVAGLSVDRVYFLHDAPRGPGTANAYLLLDKGVSSNIFINAVNDYINKQGHHGHGDDMRCFALHETQHDVIATIHTYTYLNLDKYKLAELSQAIELVIRCAFRENAIYPTIIKTYPYSRFSFSKLAEFIHQEFPSIESITFNTGDIISELAISRLRSVKVVIDA